MGVPLVFDHELAVKNGLTAQYHPILRVVEILRNGKVMTDAYASSLSAAQYWLSHYPIEVESFERFGPDVWSAAR